MNIIYFLLIGLVAGWLAGQLMKGSGFGPLGDMAVGVVGALIGGYLFGGIFLVGGLVGSLLSATAGACLLIFVIKLVKRNGM